MQGFGRDGNTIDTASIQRDWLSSMSNIVVENSLLSTKSCIFATPKLLFRNNEKAYVPTAFTIGPLHHGKPEFKEEEQIKLKYTRDLISRVEKWKPTIVQDLVEEIASLEKEAREHGKLEFKKAEQIKLKYARDLITRVEKWKPTIVQDLVEEIAGLEKEARECYSVPVEPTRDEFIKILLVDGCFLIELFLKSHFPEDDPVLSRPFLTEVLGTDLLLLENQIPWIVLDKLFSRIMAAGTELLTQLAQDFTPSTPPGTELLTQFAWDSPRTELLTLLARDSPRTTPPMTELLTQLARDYFGDLIQEKQNIAITLLNTPQHSLGRSKRLHLLELLRSSLIGSTTTEGGDIDKWELIPSASSLIEAGVKIRKPDSTNGGMLDITFSNGILKIPPFIIHEATESLFRNMISFEQCYNRCEPRITCYAMLLDILINTPKDMDILVKNGIIRNWLNPEEATQIFNKLYYDACVTEFYYLEVCKEVNKYCKRRWPRWRAIYVRNHLSSPWAIASQVLAAIIFVLALLQTVFSII